MKKILHSLLILTASFQSLMLNGDSKPLKYNKGKCEASRCRSETHHNHHRHRRNRSETSFDYIIVGGGTAGCVLAKELSDNRRNSVLLLEWGQNRSEDPAVLDPTIASGNTLTYDPIYSSNVTSPVDLPTQLQDQFFIYSEGRLLGGSSGHNGMIAVRGTPDYYNSWAEQVNDSSWSYNSLLPLFRRLETYTPNGTIANFSQRGSRGPIFITQEPPLDQTNPIDSAFSAGFFAPFITDYNDPTNGNIGVSANQSFITPFAPSIRSFAANAFLPVGTVISENGRGLNGRKLRVRYNALVSKVLFDKKRKATHVEYLHNGEQTEVVRVRANKEIILCCGTVLTPGILERSGYGRASLLRDLDIKVVRNNPNVGENLQNHYGPTVLLAGSTSGAIFTQYFINMFPFMPNDNVRRLQVIGLSAGPGLTLLAASPARPRSLGNVHIASIDPTIEPRLNLNMYSDGLVTDVGSDAYLSVSFLKQIVSVYGPSVIRPTPAEATDDNTLLTYSQNLSTMLITYHACNTCKMGSSRSNSVVDSKLRVHGVRNLRIADNSVAPIEDGNTAWIAYVIGKKAAEFILSDN